jgi:hypothetical protein
VAYVSGQTSGLILMVQAVQECWEHLGTQLRREQCGKRLVLRERDGS